MTADQQPLQNLYREVVLDHSRNPRNFRRLSPADRHAEGHNTLCGDKVTVYAKVNGEMVEDVAFEATGCAISVASASMMTEATAGLPLSTVRDVIAAFLQVFADSSASGPTGALAALGGVRDYPSRIRCATLPWQTLRAALEAKPGTVSTE